MVDFFNVVYRKLKKKTLQMTKFNIALLRVTKYVKLPYISGKGLFFVRKKYISCWYLGQIN